MSDEQNSQKKSVADLEREILRFWRDNKIFEKSLAKKSPKGEYTFYDGPPFANGLPHYGHILAGVLKDAIPRFQTMRGYHVARRWGWDCHGLPVEYEIEKELGLKTKREIEEYGIQNFNKKAREAIMRYADDWRQIIPKTGRWVDMDRDYRTMDSSYTESVWWIFKSLYDKGLVYEGFKPMHLCPRCETTLSNFEVSQGYKDITDITVTVRLPLSKEKNTSLLVWTTTPWTLPGNMAAAVNPSVVYAKYRLSDPVEEFVIIAKDRGEEILKDKKYEIVEEFMGNTLVGRAYEPPFSYYKDAPLKHKGNAWKVYGADFVTTTDGTGIVHIAPAFGEDDLNLAKENDIPVVHHVGTDGKFKKEVADFVGESVKPANDLQATDVLILKNLSSRGLLFAKEKIQHPYPHCWRCDTPLLNYAASSWFVQVTAIKDALVSANKKISWVPSDIRDGRFGKWLLGARDWAVSRSRFWGAPIPAWRCQKCERVEIIGSLSELQERSADSGNTFFLMRHGEARSNKEGFVSASVSARNNLTEKGKREVDKAAKFLRRQSIDLIIASPLERTKETAFRTAKNLGLKKDKVIFSDLIRETGVGVFEGKPISEWQSQFSSLEDKFKIRPQGGEHINDIKSRIIPFLYETDRKYTKKNILIVSHADPLWALYMGALGYTEKQAIEVHGRKKDFIKTAEVKKLDFAPLPHDEAYTLDLHRPYIDELKFKCLCGGKMKRVPEVFDCWFESGAMPYGQMHYPFENKDIFDPEKQRGFPAHFIAEGLDQTRGWFYSLLVLGVALFGEPTYKNVITNGLVLAEDGRKMSKRLKNYPEPTDVIEKYGADALRFYLLSSPVVRAEDLRFSEEGVREIQNKVMSRLRNVVSFYHMYAGDTSDGGSVPKSNNVLDTWVRVRLTEVVNKVTEAMEQYELDKAVRPLAEFIDDLSTWYLRRSRDRFKSKDESDRKNAVATTRYVLVETAKLIAPFAPFVAEEVYRSLSPNVESVHLETWPKYEPRFPIWPNPMALFHRIFRSHGDIKILEDMAEVRHIVSVALEARASAGIKVRQPLGKLSVKSKKTKIVGNEDLLTLIKDEVNVKEVVFDSSIRDDVELDTEITEELKEEGALRDLIRVVQDLRKKEGLNPGDNAVLLVTAGVSEQQFIKKFEDELKDSTTVEMVEFGTEMRGEEVKVDNFTFNLKLKAKS
ncbi:MAG: class I tRNA ligase family protein [Parcubacteria group bacterium]|nr:class I tRNA ligase family protein [Parcubacteria group bacterium]